MTARAISLGSTLVAIGAAALTLVPRQVPLLVWNASASAPEGLYRVYPSAPVRVGDMVISCLGIAWRAFAARRHYLPLNVPLVKRVAAASGDEVCALGSEIFINGRPAAARRAFDRAGRILPHWAGCTRLGRDRVFLLMDRPDSFDGRYFGTTPRTDLVGRARLVWRR